MASPYESSSLSTPHLLSASLEGKTSDSLPSPHGFETSSPSSSSIPSSCAYPAKPPNSKVVDGHGDEFSGDDSFWGYFDEEADGASELDREWQKRREEFYNSGYRDGITAGQNASAQEGFNKGFKDSVLVGHKWGLVRGVTCALAFLPEQLREKMIETEEHRLEFQSLGESARSISTQDVLKLFHEDLQTKKLETQSGNAEGQPNQSHDCSFIASYFGKLQLLIHESPALSVHMETDAQALPRQF
ncbi:hypothetical protein Ancab_034509 [Ancistrocladus abbreviatus]